MTAVGLILAVLATALLWAGVTGKDPLPEIRAALTGTKKLRKT